MRIIAVTSGKGGVGKTTLSLNLARQLSLTGSKTLLVDFDVHNKGATSLFLDQVEQLASDPAALSLAGLLANSTEPAGRPMVCRLDQPGNLSFVPAVKPRELIQWASFQAPCQILISRMAGILQNLAAEHGFEWIILDCYGGIDSLTVAAAGLAHDTIIVNEPDLITFSGTLLLYSYLSDQYADAPQKPHIHFVINRITTRHSFDFLSSEYAKHLAPLAFTDRILAYLPFDRLIMETFGDYAFFTELIPRSLITKKLRLLVNQLTNIAVFPDIERMRPSSRVRLFRRTAETKFADPEAILRALVSIPIWLILPSFCLFLLPALSMGVTLTYAVIWQLTHIPVYLLLVLLLALGVFEPVQISRWLFRASEYKRRKRALKRKAPALVRVGLAVFGWIYSAVPAIAGLAFLASVVLYGASIFPGWRDISTWGGTVSGIGPGADLSGLRMSSSAAFQSGMDLRAARFDSAQMSGVKLVALNLDRASLRKADLARAVLTGSSLVRADFQDAQLGGASFENADLSNANFTGTSLPTLTAFSGAKLAGATFKGADAAVGVLVYARLNGAALSDEQSKAVDAWLKLHPGSGVSFEAIEAVEELEARPAALTFESRSPDWVLHNYEELRSRKLYENSLKEPQRPPK